MDVITLHNISKKYSLSQERPVLLKNLFVPQKKEEVWALKNVTLNIKKGESIGIIGENGSGKSTLLKVIAGITTATRGSVKINGRVGSLIELGAGFHQDLTGRENIYLNGTLLGFTKKELDKKYDEIVEFADIGEYINQPIRTYSSGMTVRLSFSVAVHLYPDILLIDEVLAVGDAEFQQKCLEKMSNLKKLKKTIIFISHNLILVEYVCRRVLWLDKSKLKYDGLTTEAIRNYNENIRVKEKIPIITNKKRSKDLLIEKVEIFNKNNKKSSIFTPRDFAKIRIFFRALKTIQSPVFGIHIHNNTGYYCHGTTTFMKNKKLDKIVGCGYIDYDIENLLLLGNNGWENSIAKYYISAFAQIEEENLPRTIDYYKNAQSFFIQHKDKIDQHGVVLLNATWSNLEVKK